MVWEKNFSLIYSRLIVRWFNMFSFAVDRDNHGDNTTQTAETLTSSIRGYNNPGMLERARTPAKAGFFVNSRVSYNIGGTTQEC
jgi:hypothetical protein